MERGCVKHSPIKITKNLGNRFCFNPKIVKRVAQILRFLNAQNNPSTQPNLDRNTWIGHKFGRLYPKKLLARLLFHQAQKNEFSKMCRFSWGVVQEKLTNFWPAKKFDHPTCRARTRENFWTSENFWSIPHASARENFWPGENFWPPSENFWPIPHARAHAKIFGRAKIFGPTQNWPQKWDFCDRILIVERKLSWKCSVFVSEWRGDVWSIVLSKSPKS